MNREATDDRAGDEVEHHFQKMEASSSRRVGGAAEDAESQKLGLAILYLFRPMAKLHSLFKCRPSFTGMWIKAFRLLTNTSMESPSWNAGSVLKGSVVLKYDLIVSPALLNSYSHLYMLVAPSIIHKVLVTMPNVCRSNISVVSFGERVVSGLLYHPPPSSLFAKSTVTGGSALSCDRMLSAYDEDTSSVIS